MQNPTIQIIECPRDAMQGWTINIPTQIKIEYINQLLQCGFHTLDFGSFVSPKAIPQMADTAQVIAGINLQNTPTKLLAIIANVRGANEAVKYNEISYLGYPLSISPTFQLRNTNSTIDDSLLDLQTIQTLCIKHSKQLVVYLSMAFGNPYNDDYNETMLLQYANKVSNLGVHIISLADTVGVATPLQISTALTTLIPTYNHITFGVHLHTTSTNWEAKLNAALAAGCTRIDGAINGIGGCPMAGNNLVGNLATENILALLHKKNIPTNVNLLNFTNAMEIANTVFM